VTSPLQEDADASAVARKLRDYSDADLDRIPTLSPPHLALLCASLNTTEIILGHAQRYESRRRQAFGGVR
jgi:hypothetical protein